jgi:hypothetical protein
LRGILTLEELVLADTQVTDKGLLQLQELHGLKILDVQGTVVTLDGLTRLQAKLPNCVIMSDDHECRDEGEDSEELGSTLECFGVLYVLESSLDPKLLSGNLGAMLVGLRPDCGCPQRSTA